MPIRSALFACIVSGALTASAAEAPRAAPSAASPEAQTAPQAPDSRAVMTGDQVIEILDETVDWYRTLGVQQQAATQPSDLLILYANRQIAEKVMAVAFEIARANAELLSSEAGEAKARADAAAARSLSRTQKQLDDRRRALQLQIEALRQSGPSGDADDQQNQLAVLQSELDLVNARRNMLNQMVQFEHQSDADGFGANTLKAHIDAIAASIPAETPTPAPATPPPSSTTSAGVSGIPFTQFGIWDLAATVFRLSAKARTIETIDQRTAQLQETLNTIRRPPLEQLRRLAARGDELAQQAGSNDAGALRGARDQYDTLAWLYQQTSSIVTPLSRADVLLGQYRTNLDNWRDLTRRQYHDALRTLALRLALFAVMLSIVFGIAAVWKRMVFRYVHDARRRARLLLLRKIVLWALVVAIVASTIATELGSLATFAGLITAGLAVAMQSVLVSVVGYFFLIGKYGVRVGDRVQIGNVTGEVIDLGLVRMHLMELSGRGLMSPTGRVVAFANSIIFQASGGLFKQIPGVNLAWNEITLALPPAADYAALKDQLTVAVTNVINDYREEIVRQARTIQKASSSEAMGEPEPQVQLRFAAAGVEAIVRYPVQLTLAAEIDERVSRELLAVISAHQGAPAAA